MSNTSVFLSYLSKIALLNWALGSLSHLLKFPPLVGYMMSGIILGSFFTGYTQNPAVMLIMRESANIGLILLMFITGMEINVVDFFDRNKGAGNAIKVVTLQLVFSMSIIMASVYAIQAMYRFFLNQIIVIDNSSLQFISLITALVFLNSTAIAIKLLESRNNKNTYLGKTIISILVTQDIFLIPILIGLQSFRDTVSLNYLFFKIFLTFICMYVVRMIIAMSKYTIFEFQDKDQENPFLAKPLVPIGLCAFAALSAWLFEALGLSDIYGAFIAGMLVGNLAKDNNVMATFEPIVDIMSMPFFMNIGIMLNLAQLIKYWHIVFISSCAVLVIKFMYNYVAISVAKRNSIHFTEHYKIVSALLLSQVSEFSFVLIELINNNLRNIGNYDEYMAIVKCTTMTCLTIGSVFIVIAKKFAYRYNDVRHSDVNDQV